MPLWRVGTSGGVDVQKYRHNLILDHTRQDQPRGDDRFPDPVHRRPPYIPVSPAKEEETIQAHN